MRLLNYPLKLSYEDNCCVLLIAYKSEKNDDEITKAVCQGNQEIFIDIFEANTESMRLAFMRNPLITFLWNLVIEKLDRSKF